MKRILLILLFVFIICAPLILSNKLYDYLLAITLVIIFVLYGLFYSFFKYFVSKKYFKTSTEIVSIDNYKNDKNEIVYKYRSNYTINNTLFEYNFELDYLRKIGNKLQIFVKENDYYDVILGEEVYNKLVTSLVASMLIVPVIIYNIL